MSAGAWADKPLVVVRVNQIIEIKRIIFTIFYFFVKVPSGLLPLLFYPKKSAGAEGVDSIYYFWRKNLAPRLLPALSGGIP